MMYECFWLDLNMRKPPKLIDKACVACGKVRQCENRPGRQIMCRECRCKRENVPSYRGLGKLVACVDCGKTRMTWPCYARNGRKPAVRCKSCKPAGYVGEQNHNWKGGITPINRRIRNSHEYAAWRKAVFERDRYTCQECGQVGNELHADHIKPFSMHPESRFDINNGRALCRRCHMLTPSYLGGARKLANQAKCRGPMLPFP